MAFQVDIASIRLRTVPRAEPEQGQNIVVSVILADGREVDVIDEFGAMRDLTIDHTVHKTGVAEAIKAAK